MKLENFDFRLWDNSNQSYIRSGLNSKGDTILPVITKIPFLQKSILKILQINKNNEVNIIDSSYYIDEFTDSFVIQRDIEIEFYTGYTDKNGNKIYVGDIIKYGEVIDIVTDDKPKNEYLKVFEVIGNIHQNKDLLKGV